MAELVALRAILLSLLFKQAELAKVEGMQRVIARADSDKLNRARERLAQTAAAGRKIVTGWFSAGMEREDAFQKR